MSDYVQTRFERAGWLIIGANASVDSAGDGEATRLYNDLSSAVAAPRVVESERYGMDSEKKENDLKPATSHHETV